MTSNLIPIYCNSSEAEREEAIVEMQSLVPDASLEELLTFLEIKKLLETHNESQYVNYEC